MKVLWLTNIPSPYRVAFFNELGRLCDLTVLFEKRASRERDASWNEHRAETYRAVFMNGVSVGVAEAFCPAVVRYLHRGRFDRVVVTNYADPTGILAVAVLKARHIPYSIEGDGALAGSPRGVKARLKRWLFAGAEHYFSTAAAHDAYYQAYGVPATALVRYPFTSLHESDLLSAPLSAEEKQALRRKLGITENRVLLAVGQFIPRKGFDVLLQALAVSDRDIGCYIVGGAPTEEYRALVRQAGLTHVRFLPFKRPEELKDYYRAADVFVLPTREDIWGLVINEALANGVPVVTTDRCVAGCELIGTESVGSIVPAEDSAALAAAIERQLRIPAASRFEAIHQAIAPYTVENMARVHQRVLEEERKGGTV